MRPPVQVASHVAPKKKLDISHSYILMVQHLIERCLILFMDREDCAKALWKYARVNPVVTLIVWKELEKENREFFSAYSKHKSTRHVFTQVLEEATTKLSAQKLEPSPCDPLITCSTPVPS